MRIESRDYLESRENLGIKISELNLHFFRNIQWTKGYPLHNDQATKRNIFIHKDSKFAYSCYGNYGCCLTCKTAGATVYKMRGICKDSYLGKTVLYQIHKNNIVTVSENTYYATMIDGYYGFKGNRVEIR